MTENRFIFETKRTRTWRYIKNSFLFFGFFLLLYFLFCFIFFSVASKENSQSREMLLKQGPDVIIAFTGDFGRIPYAMSVLKNYPKSKILITGVSPLYTVEKFVKHFNEKYPTQEISSEDVSLDALASNTVENVIFTMRYLILNPGLRNILIISHDYHILRIKTIVGTIDNLDDPRDFYYHGVQTDYFKWRNIKIFLNETLKMIKTSIFLALWEKNSRDISPLPSTSQQTP